MGVGHRPDSIEESEEANAAKPNRGAKRPAKRAGRATRKRGRDEGDNGMDAISSDVEVAVETDLDEPMPRGRQRYGVRCKDCICLRKRPRCR